jgi:uncharacterized protein (DUF58 family)
MIFSGRGSKYTMPSFTLRERLDLRRFFQGEKPADGPIVLSHRRIFIVPNRRGLGLALLLLIQWLTAINYNSNLGFVLTFLLVAVSLLAMLQGYRNLSELRFQPRQAKPVFAGEQAGFEVFISNPTPLPRYAVWLRLKGAQPVRVDIATDEGASAVLGIRAERRGWFHPGTVTVYTEFPLGIFHAWSPLNFRERVLVYPKPADDSAPFPVASGYGKLSRERHSAEEFAGFQAYQAGDPLRNIHWKGVAKGHAPQVKRYAGEQADDLLFSLDETPGADLEARLSRICRWILDAEAAGLRYALILPGTRLPPHSGADHCRRCLEALALFDL